MFDAVRNNKRIVQVFLVLITLPFAFWGVESYIHSSGGGGDMASVGGSSITPQEFAQAMRDQQERLRGMYGREFNPAMLETLEARQALLDSLVSQRLVQLATQKANMTLTDAQLKEFLATVPAFQENGQYSIERVRAVIRNQGLTEQAFEAKLRRDLLAQQLVTALVEGSIVSRGATERVMAVQLEEREVGETLIRPEQFAGQVKLTAEAIKDFYEKNRKLFEVPERIRAEYLVLSLDTLGEQTQVPDDEVKSAYEKNVAKYVKAEERRASHILIQVPKSAPDDAQKAGREKAEALLAQLKKSPNDFAKLAKDSSQDPGSATNGGDLGYFPRGAMVKPFDDAVFDMKENQLSDVVRSDFGYHIIKLTGIRPAKGRSFEEVRGDIATELKAQVAMKKFAEAAESFSNTVYEQADSLKPAADKFKLEIKQTGMFDKVNRAAAGPLASNEKLLSALFAEDALKNQRNTEAVEVAPNTLVSARIIEHKPAELRPLEAVKAEIEKQLTAEETAKLALKDGEAKLAQLAQGEKIGVSWSPTQTLTRQGVRGLAPEGLKAIFKAAPDKLPSYTGVQLPGGAYALYRISAIRPGVTRNDDPRAKALRGQLVQFSGGEDFNAYLTALRVRFPVKVNKAVLETKERQ